MKRSSILLPLFAVAMMASCSKDRSPSNAPVIDQSDEKGAYVSVAIKNAGTRADLPSQPGTTEESSVSSVRLLTFDRSYDYIGYGDSNDPKGTGNATFSFEVSPSAYYFFAIANPTDDIKTALNNISGNWNTVESALQTVLTINSATELSKYMSDNAFVMANAGSYVDNVETVLAKPADSNFTDKGLLKIDSINPPTININVDRMVAKFKANVGPTFVVRDSRDTLSSTNGSGIAGDETSAGLYAKIEGVRLNVTNRKSYIYSHIKAVNSEGDDYRADPNMGVAGEAAQAQGVPTPLTSNFLWLHNYESPVFNPIANSTEYVFENEATGEFCNYNNLTQLVVKATYRPTGFNSTSGWPTTLTHEPADGNTWFQINVDGMGTFQMTFTGLVTYYKALRGDDPAYTGYEDDATADKMDRQLQHMMAKATNKNGIEPTTARWDDANLTCTVLNSIPNGGYVAATVPDGDDYIIEFYQFGHNYYDIFIKHFDHNEVAVGYLGRWGMVRNNSYTLSINSISKAGLPYIPDPTDPEINDPKNPKPTDPELADPDMADIDATIVVNNWTMWTQNEDL